MSRCWVVIPSFNEGPVLAQVLDGVLKTGVNAVLVDDGSSDGTRAVAVSLPVHYLRHRVNLGQGAALQTGIRYALNSGAETIVTFDGDGQMDPADIGKLCGELEARKCDVVLGSRFLSAPPRGITTFRKFLLKAAVFFTRLTTGLKITDTHNGFRAFTRSAAEKLSIRQNGMAHASEILDQIARHKLSFVEMPVSICYSAYSSGKGQKSFNAFNILWEMFFR